MSTSNNKKEDFLFAVFTELNEHIRATDEKSVLIAGSFVALIAVIAVQAIDKFEVSWKYFALSLFILFVGFCVYMLQNWYRAWKKHYLEVCYSIGLELKKEYNIADECLPFWLRKRERSIYSADKFLLLLPSVINLLVFFVSAYLLWHLLPTCAPYQALIVLLYAAACIGCVVLTRRKLINPKNFLDA